MNRYDEYSRARDVMLFHTDTPEAPWTVVNSNEKKRARLEAIRHVVWSLDYRRQGRPGRPRAGPQRGASRS